jgi:hypothetical protein
MADNLGQADTAVLDQIVQGLNPGVAPPDYRTAAHWTAHRRLGANLLTAPSILGDETPEPPPVVWKTIAAWNLSGTTVGIWSGDNIATVPISNFNVFVTPNLTLVTNPAPIEIYQVVVQPGSGDLILEVPGVTAGTEYKLRLHFIENYFTAVGSRVFNVLVGGTQVEANVDLIALTGALGYAWIIEAILKASATTINVTLQAITSVPCMSGVELQGSA